MNSKPKNMAVNYETGYLCHMIGATTLYSY